MGAEGATTNEGEPAGGDGHEHVRYFKLLEVAYHMAKHGYYSQSAVAANLAVEHYRTADVGQYDTGGGGDGG